MIVNHQTYIGCAFIESCQQNERPGRKLFQKIKEFQLEVSDMFELLLKTDETVFGRQSLSVVRDLREFDD
jgi:hypothetical protein